MNGVRREICGNKINFNDSDEKREVFRDESNKIKEN